MIENIQQGRLPRGKKAVIALTSWKKRINTVGLTIFNLFTMCGPEFHIVLTLAEEEFPLKELELPRDLLLMNKAGVFEILWVYKNYRAFKKWVFCAKRYPTVPVISADDDCLYIDNFAEILYQYHQQTHAYICTFDAFHAGNRNQFYPNNSALIRGAATLYFNRRFSDAILKAIEVGISNITVQDDNVYDSIAATQNISVKRVNKSLEDILRFHDTNDALGEIYATH
jgi:hypothetical protein